MNHRGTLQVRVAWTCDSCGAWQTTRIFGGVVIDDIVRALRDAGPWKCAACQRAASEKKGKVSK